MAIKKIHTMLPGLYLVDLDVPQLTGFHQFISSWIYTRQETTLIVDPGPPSTIPVLLDALDFLNIKKVDYLLLTHIHPDHGGGAGHLVRAFPDLPVLCHPKGIPHLADPEKLWQGSLKVLGDVARAYGEMVPLPAENMGFERRFRVGPFEIEVVETPGHAAHHLSFLIDGLLFAAELAGVSIAAGAGFFQRPATPPRFIYEVYKNSLKTAAALGAQQLCLGHYGVRGDPNVFFESAEHQLERWLETVHTHMRAAAPYNEQNVFEELLQSDPLMEYFKTLPADVQQRERYFSLNSLRGMYGYLSE